jgi:hypothetical protein
MCSSRDSSSLGLGDLGIDVNGAAGNGGTTGRNVSIQYYIRRWLSITTSTNADGSSEIFLNLTRHF